MLRLENIVKDYQTKALTVRALDDISLCFRKSEFVSILGPSGCGKTTMLNILGGLDHYTSGDLVIDGRSTKFFKDHDWDIYRNHRIGFIFQSYNLIPHQNILDNVSLALTIAGINKKERDERAKIALDEVGLKDLYNKMPNQLSGGQCQRVAIARALVNEPEILLADEPTGALDSNTSIQIMDLIQEISKKKLVIMVTHNPDLAFKYSSRIVKLLDGKLISDSNPYSIDDEKSERETQPISTNTNTEEKIDLDNEINVNDKNSKIDSKLDDNLVSEESSDTQIFNSSNENNVTLSNENNTDDNNLNLTTNTLIEQSSKEKDVEKAKMSWWQAFKLSGKNLLSKIKRTIMTVFAASIGIIGVSSVLAVSSGVQSYITDMQDDMLSGNPISVEESTFNLAKLMSLLSPSEKKEIVKDGFKDGYLNVNYVTETIFDTAKTVTGASVTNVVTKEYENYIDSIPKDYYSSIAKYYGININNNIYVNSQINSEPENTQVSLTHVINLATQITSKAVPSDFSSFVSNILGQINSAFSQSIDNPDYLKEQYDVEGKIATEADELMLVTNKNGAVSDMALTLFGYYGQNDFQNLIYKFTEDPEYDSELYDKNTKISFSEIKDREFYYYPNDIVFSEENDPSKKLERPYQYNYKTNDEMKSELDEKGLKLKVVGILKPKENRQFCTLNSGFYYTPALTKRFLDDGEKSNFTKFIKNESANSKTNSYMSSSVKLPTADTPTDNGIYYDYDFIYRKNDAAVKVRSFIGDKVSDLPESYGSMYTLTPNQVGGINVPTSIEFYPVSFKKKYLITEYLDKWNSDSDLVYKDSTSGEIIDTTLTKDERTNIEYTDNLDVIIKLVNTLIQVVTIALIAFTSLSLVVSTVMIAIITYVSVMERIKEIGIIRSLGGRKKDVSRLFNIETFIIGTSAGVFGILVTYILQIIFNAVIHFNVPMVSNMIQLPILTALIVIAISILLSVISGLVPASSAARKDPVVALRSNE